LGIEAVVCAEGLLGIGFRPDGSTHVALWKQHVFSSSLCKPHVRTWKRNEGNLGMFGSVDERARRTRPSAIGLLSQKKIK
jgi:hypothetical protein